MAEPDEGPSDATPHVLAVDLGVRHLVAGVVGPDGEVGVRDRVVPPTRQPWVALTRLVDRVLAATPEESRPTVCGVTGPGPVLADIGEFRSVTVTGWEGVPIRRLVAETTGLPTVISSTGHAHAIANAPDDGHLIGLYLGDQVDGGIVRDGQLLSGANGHLGAFGHLLVDPDGPVCACGATGCLDLYAGAVSLEAQFGREVSRVPDATVDRAGIMVARACASLAAMLDIHRIALGGPVVTALGRRLTDAMSAELDQRSRLVHLEEIHIRAVRQHVLVGGAAVARHRVATGGIDPAPAVTAT
ncbi:MAG: ROK family protein [Ilumatobacter sp.]